MKIWHISDTHNLHHDLKVPDVDMVIHSGDFANSKNSAINSNEVVNFLNWFADLKIKHKILIAGNHDISVANRMVQPNLIKDCGIHYLENSDIIIENLKIWGSPVTPSFGDGWAFNQARHKMSVVWEQIPKDADIIVTHGPPRGVLDLTYSRQYSLGNWNEDKKIVTCGCKSLLKKIDQIKPILSLFGHVHNNDFIENAGIRKLSNLVTLFSNGSVVCDGKLNLVNNGNVLSI